MAGARRAWPLAGAVGGLVAAVGHVTAYTIGMTNVLKGHWLCHGRHLGTCCGAALPAVWHLRCLRR